MAGVKDLDAVSSAIMCMDTLAMDSMDNNGEALGAQRSNADSSAGERAHEDEVDEREDGVGIGSQEFDDDEGLMTDPGTPGTPPEEFAQELDEANELEDEKGWDDEALDSDPGTPPEDVTEAEAMTVDGAEHDVEVEEKALQSEKFVAPFPITRVKRIIKLDKDVRLVSSDAIALVAQASALFVQSLSSASFSVMLRTKRKTIRGPDVVLAAKSTRQFRECLGDDLATLLEESNNDTGGGEEGLGEKDHEIGGEPGRKQPKSAKKHQLAPPPGSRPITNFFKA